MELLNDASTREQLLIKKAKQQQIPITGSIELLPLCNMNCDMCYVRLSREEMEKKRSPPVGRRMAECGTADGACRGIISAADRRRTVAVSRL